MQSIGQSLFDMTYVSRPISNTNETLPPTARECYLQGYLVGITAVQTGPKKNKKPFKNMELADGFEPTTC